MSRGSAPRIVLPARPLGEGPTMLRRWRADDADALFAICQDPEIHRWVRISAAAGREDARAWIDGVHEAARVGLAATLAVVDAGDDLLGAVGLVRVEWADRRAEVGYWLAAAARGHGHMTRAVEVICRWGFRELGLERISLLAAVGNPASQAVARRAGFTREARLRAYDSEPGPIGREDFVCFGRLAADPASPSAHTSESE